MSKLQEIKKRIDRLVGFESASDDDLYYMSKRHIDWLLSQAEKVEYWMKQHRKRSNELEDAYFKIQLLENKLQQAQAKAERYEKALKFYADEENHMYEVTYDMVDVIESPVMKDYGKIARQALEGEEK